MKFSWIDIGVPKVPFENFGGGEGGFWGHVAQVVIIHKYMYVAKFGNIQIEKNGLFFLSKWFHLVLGGKGKAGGTKKNKNK